jgi:hypothetical protein
MAFISKRPRPPWCVLDQAGWHVSKTLPVPPKITLVPLPAKSPELNRSITSRSSCAFSARVFHSRRAGRERQLIRAWATATSVGLLEGQEPHRRGGAGLGAMGPARLASHGGLRYGAAGDRAARHRGGLEPQVGQYAGSRRYETEKGVALDQWARHIKRVVARPAEADRRTRAKGLGNDRSR